RLNRLSFFEQFGLWDRVAEFQVIRPGQHLEIFRGIKLAPGFEHDHAQAFFGHLFRGPAAGRARTYDYCVVNYLLRHCFSSFEIDRGCRAQTLLQSSAKAKRRAIPPSVIAPVTAPSYYLWLLINSTLRYDSGECAKRFFIHSLSSPLV